jgi:hypothetical protein
VVIITTKGKQTCDSKDEIRIIVPPSYKEFYKQIRLQSTALCMEYINDNLEDDFLVETCRVNLRIYSLTVGLVKLGLFTEICCNPELFIEIRCNLEITRFY